MGNNLLTAFSLNLSARTLPFDRLTALTAANRL